MDEAFELRSVSVLLRRLLRERAADLIAEACAWSVGLSDTPHHRRRHGHIVPTGMTLGERAAAGQLLSGEEDASLELGEAEPGTFRDALNAVTADGTLHLARLEVDVLWPFVTATCLMAADRLREDDPTGWAELLDELGEDGVDVGGIIRAAEWDVPLRLDAEELVVSALGDVPLVEVEAEGLPLSLVRAAETLTRHAAEPHAEPASEEELAGALFLAQVAVREAGLAVPVPPEDAGILLQALQAEGLADEEVLRLLPRLPLQRDTVCRLEADIIGGPDRS